MNRRSFAQLLALPLLLGACGKLRRRRDDLAFHPRKRPPRVPPITPRPLWQPPALASWDGRITVNGIELIADARVPEGTWIFLQAGTSLAPPG